MGHRKCAATPTPPLPSAQRTRFQLRRPSEREGGVCCKPELGGETAAPNTAAEARCWSRRWLMADTARSMIAVEVLLAWLVLALVATVATVWWSTRLWRRRGEIPKRALAVAAIVATAAIAGALGTVAGLVMAVGAVGGESVDPSHKARMLAEGISEAINCTALGLVVWIPSAILFRFMLRKRSRRSA
jgi:hypothetical protein